ncbi:hypothetical protein BGX38DRAFT_1239899, partial [Terfezia claveryi]
IPSILTIGFSTVLLSRSESVTMSGLFHFQSLRSGARMSFKLLGPSMIMSFLSTPTVSPPSTITGKGSASESPQT